MKAIVTGSSGFIGSHMVRLLQERGHSAWLLDLDFATHAENYHDVRRLTEAEFVGMDWVFHFAGLADLVPSINEPRHYFDTNAAGTVRVLEAARYAGVKKFLYAASSSCYGPNPPCPVTEHVPVDCAHPYAFSKWAGEQACMHWHRVYGLPVNSLRLFNVYGRGQRSKNYGAVIPTFLRQKLSGEPLTIVGDGGQARDFVHVTDVCEAFLAAAESPMVGQIWNVGYALPQNINKIARMIGGPAVNIPERPGEPYIILADTRKIKADLGWYPKITFPVGMAEMLEHIEDWRDAPLWTPDTIAEQTAQWFKALA